MKIEEYLKYRDFALFQSEIHIKDNQYCNVEILEIQQYWDVDLESLFEFDILTDVKREQLKDGSYFCSVLIKGYANEDEDMEIVDFSFEAYTSPDRPQKNITKLPF